MRIHRFAFAFSEVSETRPSFCGATEKNPLVILFRVRD